jgi:hypothetical protein
MNHTNCGGCCLENPGPVAAVSTGARSGGWRGACIAAFDPDLGEAPWLGSGYGTFPEVFRNRARPAIAAAGSDATMKRGLY